MSAEPTHAYVLGLLTDLERQVAALNAARKDAQARALAVDGPLQEAAERFVKARDGARQYKQQAAKAAADMAASNGKLGRLHQEMAILQRRADELREVIRQTVDAAQQNALRRNRATFLLQLEDRQATVQKLSAAAAQARETLHTAQGGELTQGDRERQVGQELDALQKQLPSPHLALQTFEAQAARAHCWYFLDRQKAPWQRELVGSIDSVRALHEDLRAGKYRLDENSHLVGGRALGSTEAIYGAAALGDWESCGSLFALACDESLFFHHIFQVFRAWCLGLYLQGRHAELRQLCELHMYAEGVRGHYAMAFAALLQRDAALLAAPLKKLVGAEWRLHERSATPGLGVVNLTALAVCRLAAAARLKVPALGATVPLELLAPT